MKLCPPEIFKNVKGFTLPMCTIFVSGMALISPSIVASGYTRRLNRIDASFADERLAVRTLFTTVPQTIGWYSLAYNCAATTGAMVSGILVARIKHTRWQFFVVAILMAIVLVSIGAFFVGASQVLATLIIQFGAEDHYIGVATGLSGSFRTVGGCIAIAIYSSIFRQHTNTNLASDVSVAALEAGLPASSVPALLQAILSGNQQAIEKVRGITPNIPKTTEDAVQSLYAGRYSTVFLVSTSFGVVSVVSAFFVKSVDDCLTRHVVRELEQPPLLSSKGFLQEASKAVDHKFV
ncbi:uncharacterized protein Z518_00384 [Rhinocladiella mackenziei CBS 650.93]|uniref:Major facilitator superfamily (MFS) profile domain-containing protein n=1 Tax=Rhinocladiella mackenziei CBS 650.93 TaxID=1442369 RepID=A0A0D2JIP1_9EURO|nr:uncharacterized protein Z518_00384 [Rhinocladiella mackenziei CBS 650.93]KIX09305.1 hypothetical protein Z518_00384 [Rhinocladiella mackenziei CBS 650.93]